MSEAIAKLIAYLKARLGQAWKLKATTTITIFTESCKLLCIRQLSLALHRPEFP